MCRCLLSTMQNERRQIYAQRLRNMNGSNTFFGWSCDSGRGVAGNQEQSTAAYLLMLLPMYSDPEHSAFVCL